MYFAFCWEGARIEIYWVIIPKAVVVHNPAPSMEVGTHNFWPQPGMSIWKVPGIMASPSGFLVWEKEKFMTIALSVFILGSPGCLSWCWRKRKVLGIRPNASVVIDGSVPWLDMTMGLFWPNWADNASRYKLPRDLWIVTEAKTKYCKTKY